MKKLFVILSPKHSEGDKVMFWRSNDAGYTFWPWEAGLYSEEQVMGNLGYYNDGYNSLAVELTNDGLRDIGFYCHVDWELARKNKLKPNNLS